MHNRLFSDWFGEMFGRGPIWTLWGVGGTVRAPCAHSLHTVRASGSRQEPIHPVFLHCTLEASKG